MSRARWNCPWAASESLLLAGTTISDEIRLLPGSHRALVAQIELPSETSHRRVVVCGQELRGCLVDVSVLKLISVDLTQLSSSWLRWLLPSIRLLLS